MITNQSANAICPFYKHVCGCAMMDKHCLNTPVARNSGPLSNSCPITGAGHSTRAQLIASRLFSACFAAQASKPASQQARPRPTENSIVTAPEAALKCQPIIASTRHPISPRGRMFLFAHCYILFFPSFFSRAASTSIPCISFCFVPPHLMPPLPVIDCAALC